MKHWDELLRLRRRRAFAVAAPEPGFLVPENASFWVQNALNFTADPIQAAILDSVDPHLLLLCTRQFGKTTLTALKALHFALRHPATLTVVASPTARRSGEWIRTLRGFLELLDLPLRRDGIHPYSAVLPNRSRLIGLPGSIHNNRGYAAHLLIIDEAAFVDDALYRVLTACQAATNGAQWLISSAGPAAGFFYDQWNNQQVPWRRFCVTAAECPRISPQFLARERHLIGDAAFEQEFFCRFQSPPESPITRELLEKTLDAAYRPINQGKPLWDDLCAR